MPLKETIEDESMKTFNEWLELREAGFFSNLFGKNKQPTPKAATTPPPKKGMSVDDFQRLFDGPNAKQAPASHNEPAPQIRQPQMAPPKTTSNPVEYIENIANKYWKGKGELNELWEYWNQSRQENDKNRRGRHLYQIYRSLSLEGRMDAHIKDSLLKILEDECKWEAFPEEDEFMVTNPSEGNEINGNRLVSGSNVSVVVKGFKIRYGEVRQPAVVERIK
jgi:hypothetical protein